jgi:hypothetical protein
VCRHDAQVVAVLFCRQLPGEATDQAAKHNPRPKFSPCGAIPQEELTA